MGSIPQKIELLKSPIELTFQKEHMLALLRDEEIKKDKLL